MTGLLKQIQNYINEQNNSLVLKNKIGLGEVHPPSFGSKDIMSEIVAALKNAKFEILITNFKLEMNSEGEADLLNALEALSKTAKEGNFHVNVRILINRPVWFAGMIEYELKNQKNKFQDLAPDHFENITLYYMEHKHVAFGAYHSKNWIIDGKTAFLCSGDMMSVDHNYKDGKLSWREICTKIEGEIVQEIRASFITSWQSKNSHPINSKTKAKIEDLNIAVEEKDAEKNKSIPILYLAKKANGSVLKRNELSPYTIAILQAIRHAKNEINIMTPNLNQEHVLKALAIAALRGVKVNLLVSKFHNLKSENRFFQGGDNQKSVSKIMKLIHQQNGNANFNIRWVAKNMKPLPHHHVETLHAKLVIIDDAVFAGSSVLDNQSAFQSSETDYGIESEEHSRPFKKIFRLIFAEGISYEDELAQCVQRRNGPKKQFQ